jgi:fucose permease
MDLAKYALLAMSRSPARKSNTSSLTVATVGRFVSTWVVMWCGRSSALQHAL